MPSEIKLEEEFAELLPWQRDVLKTMTRSELKSVTLGLGYGMGKTQMNLHLEGQRDRIERENLTKRIFNEIGD